MLALLIATAVLVFLLALLLIDFYLVGSLLAQTLFSVFIASLVGWGLWVVGNMVVASFYPENAGAWEANLITAMTVGPPLARFLMLRYISSIEGAVPAHVAVAFVGAAAGTIVGRVYLGEALTPEFNTTTLGGTPRITGAWVGALIGGHLPVLVTGIYRIRRNQEP